MLKIVIVVGNPKPNSRTSRIAQMMAERLLGGAAADVNVIDLADHADEIFKWPSDKMARLNATVADADLAIFASPTYKASYTALLKAFLDRYPAGGLKGVAAVAVMTGADMGHSMAPNVNLVPLLLELGAIVPIRGAYFNTGQMDRIDGMVEEFADELRDSLSCLTRIETGISQVADASKAKEVAL